MIQQNDWDILLTYAFPFAGSPTTQPNVGFGNAPSVLTLNLVLDPTVTSFGY